MKPVIKALLIASFCLPFVSCKDEKSIQQEVHEKLEKQVEPLLAREKEEKPQLKKQTVRIRNKV